jgi:hypothetical protein
MGSRSEQNFFHFDAEWACTRIGFVAQCLGGRGVVPRGGCVLGADREPGDSRAQGGTHALEEHTIRRWSLVAGRWGRGGSRAGIRGRVFAAAAAVVLGGAGFQPAALAQSGPLGNLRAQYPEAGERVRTVYGAEMTAGQTPREAAEAWVGEHGAVFGGPWLELDEFREARLRRAPEGKERRVFMYRQEMDGLPVVGSSFRVMTVGEPDSGPARVVYAAGRVAIRPEGGLPEPTVTPAQALEAAKAHHKGREMVRWSEAELVAIYDDAPRGDAVAYPAWKYVGEGETLLDSFTFYVDALTGEVERYESNVMYCSSEKVIGTVDGNATPARHGTPPGPDLFGPDPWDGTKTNCPNPTELTVLRNARMVATLAGTQTVVAEAWTDDNGAYELDVPGSTTVDVYAYLSGPGWTVRHETGTPPSSPLVYSAKTGITSPGSGIDFRFNLTPEEFDTAHVNAHVQVEKTWRYLEVPEEVPSVPVVPNLDSLGGSPQALGVYVSSIPPHWIAFRNSDDDKRSNGAFSTVISHEYGHHYTFQMGMLGGVVFNEAIADVIAHMTHDTLFIGQDAYGCGVHVTDPIGNNPVYPVCSTDDLRRIELLSAIWLDLRGEIGWEETRTLHLDWMFIAQGLMEAECEPFGDLLSQSAGPSTLIEVLSVAPDAYFEVICEIFRLRGIEDNVCPESAGRPCHADCDSNGALDFWDFLCFQNAYLAGDSYADCDGDAQLTVLDFLCFQNQFIAACP